MDKDESAYSFDGRGLSKVLTIEGIRDEVSKWREWISVARNDFESLRKSCKEPEQSATELRVCFI